MGEFGLRNKRELWRVQMALSKIRQVGAAGMMWGVPGGRMLTLLGPSKHVDDGPGSRQPLQLPHLWLHLPLAASGEDVEDSSEYHIFFLSCAADQQSSD